MTEVFPVSSEVRRLVEDALQEDLGTGDLTTTALFAGPVPAEGTVVAHGPCVVAGLPLVEEVYHALGVYQAQGAPGIHVAPAVEEGRQVHPGTVLVRLRGDGRRLLAGERVALNFLQRLSGIATLTARFVAAVAGHRVKILDTRKTTPGWRVLEKYAVRVGGGANHRSTLADGILIKDNHLALASGLAGAVRQVRTQAPPPAPIEVEVSSLEEVDEALGAGADWILLDNMPVETLRRAVERTGGRALLEASGGVSLATVREIAATGVDAISIGALTHSAPAVDLSMELRRA